MAYVPRPVPSNVNELLSFLPQELTAVAQVLAAFEADEFFVRKRFAAPQKPRDGQLVYADGTTWNPGSGAGLYYYKVNAWQFIA